jgi:hypothetical protein
MSEATIITSASLREAMRDPRYWQQGHPDRTGYSAWVTQGFRALHDAETEGRDVVHVRAYMREGHQVSAYTRRNGNEGSSDSAETGEDDAGGDRRSFEIAARSRGRREEACHAQREIDELRCALLPQRLRGACWRSAMTRVAACITGTYIPPLAIGGH